MYRGVIYKYTSPSGKNYIGQTINEKARRGVFLNRNKEYAGPKINKARDKYGPENFEYQVIFAVESLVKEEVLKILDEKEIQYIEMFDSFNNGYNSDLGGGSGIHVITENTRRKLSEATTNYYKNHDSVKNVPILQYSLKGDFIREWKSINEAAREYKIEATNIGNVCKGKRNHCGNYIWRYKRDFEEIPLSIEVKIKNSKCKLCQYSLDGDLIKEWDSITEASKELGYSLGNFSTYCNGRNNHEYKGFLYYRGSETPNL